MALTKLLCVLHQVIKRMTSTWLRLSINSVSGRSPLLSQRFYTLQALVLGAHLVQMVLHWGAAQQHAPPAGQAVQRLRKQHHAVHCRTQHMKLVACTAAASDPIAKTDAGVDDKEDGVSQGRELCLTLQCPAVLARAGLPLAVHAGMHMLHVQHHIGLGGCLVGERLVVLQAVGLIADEQVAGALAAELLCMESERLVGHDQHLCGIACMALLPNGRGLKAHSLPEAVESCEYHAAGFAKVCGSQYKQDSTSRRVVLVVKQSSADLEGVSGAKKLRNALDDVVA